MTDNRHFGNWVLTEKHLSGQHDQSTHGSWAHGGKISESSHIYAPKRMIRGSVYDIGDLVDQAIAYGDTHQNIEKARADLKLLGHTNPDEEVVVRYAREKAALTFLNMKTGADFPGQLGKIDFRKSREEVITEVNKYLDRRKVGQLINRQAEREATPPKPKPTPKQESETTIADNAEQAKKLIEQAAQSQAYDPKKQFGKISVEDGKIVLSTPYDRAFVNDIHTIPGARWDGANKVWTVDPKYRESALKVFDKHFQQRSDITVVARREENQKTHAAASDLLDNAKKNSVIDPSKPVGNVRMMNDSLIIKSEYDEGFVSEMRRIDGATWDGDNKVWKVPASQAQAGLDVFAKYNQHDVPGASEAHKKYEAEQKKIYMEKHEASPDQISYIKKLLDGYISADGDPAKISDLMTGTITMAKASDLIKGLKGGARFGLEKGKIVDPDPDWFRDDPEPKLLVKAEDRGRELEPYHQEGEYYSGKTLDGEDAKLMESMGLMKYLSGWGYAMTDLGNRLPDKFTLGQADDLGLDGRMKRYTVGMNRKREIRQKFDQAKQTRKKVLLRKFDTECNDPREECSLDIVYEWAMPNQKMMIQRDHTW